MHEHVPDVGAPDPELHNSPIFDEYIDELEEGALDFELESNACYFNGASYPIGQYVRSGSELLHCEGRGVWIRTGEVRTDEQL